MSGVLPIALLSCIFQVIGGTCNFPNGFLGTWKSSNYGTFEFGTNSMYMSTDITGSSKRNYTCESNSGTKYVIRTTEPFLPFIGATTYFYAYICLDLRETSAYSYYYYQQSDKDIGFNYERAKAFNTTGIALNAVCETTVDVTEYHVMVKAGFGNSLQVTCPDIFLGVFYYNYNDTSSYCNGVSRLDVCNNNKTTLIFNHTLCSQRVGFSTSGKMGCIASVISGSNTYLTTYNQDPTVDGSTTTTFACFAATTVGSSVVASIKQTECSLNQSPTTLPTGGGILQLTANYTCLPVSTTPETKNYTWIIVGSILGFLALVGIILFLIYCLCFWWPKKRRERRIRAKKIIENEEKHPFAESSLTLDAPSSLHSISEVKKIHMFDEDVPPNPMDESTSVKIDFRGKTWIKGDKPSSNGGSIRNGVNSIDPRREFAISEIDTVSRIPHRPEEEFIVRAMSPVTTVSQRTAKSSLERSRTEKPISKVVPSLPPLDTPDSSVKRDFSEKSSKHGSQRKSAFAWTDNSDAASFFEARSQNKKRRRRRGYSILYASHSHTPASRSSRTRSTRSSFYDNKVDREDGEWEDEEVEELQHNRIVKSKTIVLDSGRRRTSLPPRPTIIESKPRQSRKQQRRKKSRQSNRSRSRGNMSNRIKSLRRSPYKTRMSIKRFSNAQGKLLQRSRTMSGHMNRPPKPFKKAKHDSIGIRLHRSYTEASIRKVNHELQLRPNYVHTAWR